MKHRILFNLSGSIAAYKACSLISKLAQSDFEVQPVCTPSTLEFVGPATLNGLSGKTVLTCVFDPTRAMDHINLAKWAELTILCPATANQINKMASGISDDIVSTLFLAHDFQKPYWIVPAMNEKMWSHPATRASVSKLTSWGIKVIDPSFGHQACGDIGAGRMVEPEILESLIKEYFRSPKEATV